MDVVKPQCCRARRASSPVVYYSRRFKSMPTPLVPVGELTSSYKKKIQPPVLPIPDGMSDPRVLEDFVSKMKASPGDRSLKWVPPPHFIGSRISYRQFVGCYSVLLSSDNDLTIFGIHN